MQRMSPKPSPITQELLSFTRFTVHAIHEATKKDLLELEELILTNKDLPQHKEIYRQLAIYYLFSERNEPKALLYLEKYKAFDLDQYEKAEVESFIGHAHTITPKYNDEKPFIDSLALYEKIKQVEIEKHKEPSMTTLLSIGFNKRYEGLMWRRKNDFEKAKEKINEAIQIQEEVLKNATLLKISTYATYVLIDLAESKHILAAIILAQAKDEKDEGKKKALIEQAFNICIEAEKLEEDFCQETQATHFMKFTTQQLKADLYTQLHEFKIAISILKTTLKEQSEFFHGKPHPDVAKTLHFLANAYRDNNDFENALLYYAIAYQMKYEVFGPGNNNLTVTADEIHKILERNHNSALTMLNHFNFYFRFDWNDVSTFKSSHDQVLQLENILVFLLPYKDKFDSSCKERLGELCHKLGAYYAHLKKSPFPDKKAIELGEEKLLIATQLLTHGQQAWAEAQLYFIYQQKQAAYVTGYINAIKKRNTDEAKTFEQSIFDIPASENCSHVLASNEPKAFSFQLKGFVLCVHALTFYERDRKLAAMSKADSAIKYEAKDLLQGIQLYEEAIKLYEDNDSYDDQWARALNRLVMMMKDYALYLQGICKEKEADEYFETAESFITQKLDVYWKSAAKDNPYVGRYYWTCTEFFEAIGNPQKALISCKLAHESLSLTEGKDSPFVKDVMKKLQVLQDQGVPRLSPSQDRKFAPAPKPEAAPQEKPEEAEEKQASKSFKPSNIV